MPFEFVEVKTKQGALRGQIKQSLLHSGKPYYAFQGIRYAKPPVGELRFKDPKPPEPWTGVRDALKDGNNCVQPPSCRFNEGDEDCLFLNVFCSKPPGRSGLLSPVLVFFHGGGYATGSNSVDAFGPDFFMIEDAVLVTPNYRCGALGFLCLGTEEVPGNAGLKDQTLALQWVRDNISSFGGDKDNVTIFGSSAGGSSVHFHLLSPQSKGLFHKAIMQSGCALNPWAIQPDPVRVALSLAQELGCSSREPLEVLHFLQSVPANDISKAQFIIASEDDMRRKHGLVFVPCVEIKGNNRFLTESPRALMETGGFTKVPVIMGVCYKEGLINLEFFKFNNEEFTKLNRNPKFFLPVETAISKLDGNEESLAGLILEFYLRGKKISWESMSEYFDLAGDLTFNVGMDVTRNYLLKYSPSPVYVYRYSYCSDRRRPLDLFPKLCPEYGDYFLTLGASHADEIQVLFSSVNQEKVFVTPSDRDLVIINKMVKAWVAFAKTSDPNCDSLGVKWVPDNIQHSHFLELSNACMLVKERMFANRMEFWDQFYSKMNPAHQNGIKNSKAVETSSIYNN